MTESNNNKWAANGIGPRQIKRVNELFSKINWEHGTYASLTRSFDGTNFQEDRRTYTEVAGLRRREDLLQKGERMRKGTPTLEMS